MTDTRAPAHPVDSEVDANYRIDVSKVDTAVLYRITKMAFRHKARMAIGICATVIAATFQLFIPQYLGQAVDQARGILAEVSAEGGARGIAEDALLSSALLLLGAAVGRGLFTMMQNYQGEAVGQLIGYRLRLDTTANFSNSVFHGMTGYTPATS